MLDFSFAHKSQDSLKKEYNFKKRSFTKPGKFSVTSFSDLAVYIK